MQIGPPTPVPVEISELGFQFADKIHILGMDIDREIVELDGNFSKTITNLKKCVDYWKRYNLTLSGRINVIKSLLFSQILYLGSFLMPSQEKIRAMQKILDELDETFSHIFYECDTVRDWHNRFTLKYLPENYFRDDRERREFFFLGRVHDTDGDNFFIYASVLIFQYCIWESKLKKKIHSYNTLELLFREIIYNFLRTNSLARKSKAKSNFKLCRTLCNGEYERDGQPVPGPPPL
jgi:hypothetical protein